jgi:copper chaperone CopZ
MMRTIEIPIEGMTCGGCAGTVHYALARTPGVVHAHVEVGAATVLYDPAHTNDQAIRGVIAQAGYLPVVA